VSQRDQPDFSIPTLGPISNESRLESRSIVSNDSDIVDGTVPATFVTGTTYKGKFYPRGCRGKIESIRVYCRRTAAGFLTLGLSPHPCMGPLYTVNIPVGLTWAWAEATLRIMWNYDSLFIFVTQCGANHSYAYDTLQPNDGHTSADTGATWQREDRRYFFRVVYDAETAGDVPISGIVNTIDIPSVSTGRDSGLLAVPATGTLYDTPIIGAGELLIAIFYTNVAAAILNLQPRIECDGVEVMPQINSMDTWFRNYVNENTPRVSIGKNDAVNNFYALVVTIPIQFKRQLRLGFTNIHAINAYSGWVFYTYKRMS